MKRVVEGVPGLRLIFDLRRVNLLFRAPPYVALSGPSRLAGLDWREIPDDYEFQIATGDVPNWFYMLGIPAELSELFALRRVTTKELRAVLVQRGLSELCRRLPDPNLGGRLGCAVVLMGWSWAVWLAEAALEALVHPVPGPERRLVHGAPLPRFTTKGMGAYVLALHRRLRGPRLRAARRQEGHRGAGRDHRSCEGCRVRRAQGGEWRGRSLSGNRCWRATPGIKPLHLPLWVLIFATDELLETSPRIVSIMVGQWTWRMLLARSTLSVFDSVYKFIRHGRHRQLLLGV